MKIEWMGALSAVLVLATAALAFDLNAAEPKKVMPMNHWAGQVGKQLPECGECLLSEADLKRFWRDWEIAAPMPTIDFKTELALVNLGHGGPVLKSLTLDGNGNLATQYVQLPTWSPKLNYVITTVKREGIKSVNGKSIEAK